MLRDRNGRLDTDACVEADVARPLECDARAGRIATRAVPQRESVGCARASEFAALRKSSSSSVAQHPHCRLALSRTARPSSTCLRSLSTPIVRLALSRTARPSSTCLRSLSTSIVDSSSVAQHALRRRDHGGPCLDAHRLSQRTRKRLEADFDNVVQDLAAVKDDV